MGENASVKIEGGGGMGRYLYIVKIGNFHPVLTSSLNFMSILEILEKSLNFSEDFGESLKSP